MKKYMLGIESSCDETSVAICDLDGKLLSNIVSSQIDIHAKYGGVMPEIASRLHIENTNYVLKEALNEAGVSLDEIVAIAVTTGPGLIGALHVGLQAAKALALALDIPLLSVHHLVGHIYANSYEKELKFPCLSLIVSGGHTELVYMPKELEFEIIGSTQDDALGEAYDKVARIIGLGYPGGPKIDKISKEGKATIKLPKPHSTGPYDVSYSGLKTYINNYVHNLEQKGEEIPVEDLATSFQKRAIDMIVDKLLLALEEYKVEQVVVAGGVSANSYLRSEVSRRVKKKFPEIEVVLPPLWCCGDNAAMIAKVGLKLYERKIYSNLEVGVKPSWPIDEYLKEE